jgi:SAM-dependent methyltransferase
MTTDIARENIDCYLGSSARREWSADNDLYEFELEIIRRHFPAAPARILDLGCGAGRTTVGLESRGYDVEAIDLSQDLVEEAQQRVTRSRVHLMDARHLAFSDNSFDAALFSFNGLDCVYPTAERLRVLAEVHRVLRPGGIFYYSGHNGLGAWYPRPGDTFKKAMKRNRGLLMAQRRSFKERTRYLAYPEQTGTQILYSAPPRVHLRELQGASLNPLAIYAARGRSYRLGPHVLEEVTDPTSWRHAAQLGRFVLTCPHLHYVAKKVAS